jgi:hypothetical protein
VCGLPPPFLFHARGGVKKKDFLFPAYKKREHQSPPVLWDRTQTAVLVSFFVNAQLCIITPTTKEGRQKRPES